MGTIIRFPKQRQDGEINYYGLELFVESCGRLTGARFGGRPFIADACCSFVTNGLPAHPILDQLLVEYGG